MRCALSVLLFLATCLRAEFTATVSIDASHPHAQLPQTIFGTFLEPIGHSIYGGLWAEILENPSFEENLWSAEAIRDMIAADPDLLRASSLGLPLPWEPLDPRQGNRYELGGLAWVVLPPKGFDALPGAPTDYKSWAEAAAPEPGSLADPIPFATSSPAEGQSPDEFKVPGDLGADPARVGPTGKAADRKG